MRVALTPQLRSSAAARTTSPWSPSTDREHDREALICARQYQRLRRADSGSGRNLEHSELVAAAMDLTFTLELRLHEAEKRISSLLCDVEFVEEFRKLCREAPGALVVRPPSMPRPAAARPCTGPPAQEAATLLAPAPDKAMEARVAKLESRNLFSRKEVSGAKAAVEALDEVSGAKAAVEALDVRVAKLEGVDFDALQEVSGAKAAVEALDVRVAKLEAVDCNGQKVQEMQKLVARESLAALTQFAELALQQDDMELQLESIRFAAPLSAQKRRWAKEAAQPDERPSAKVSDTLAVTEQLTKRQVAIESRFEDFGRTLLALLSDFQVHEARMEQRVGLLEQASTKDRCEIQAERQEELAALAT